MLRKYLSEGRSIASFQLFPTKLAGSKPRAVFSNRAQEARLVGSYLYHWGKDGATKVLLRRVIKVIQSAGTLSENYLPIMEVDSE